MCESLPARAGAPLWFVAIRSSWSGIEVVPDNPVKAMLGSGGPAPAPGLALARDVIVSCRRQRVGFRPGLPAVPAQHRARSVAARRSARRAGGSRAHIGSPHNLAAAQVEPVEHPARRPTKTVAPTTIGALSSPPSPLKVHRVRWPLVACTVLPLRNRPIFPANAGAGPAWKVPTRRPVPASRISLPVKSRVHPLAGGAPKTDQARIEHRHFEASSITGKQPPRLVEMSTKIPRISSMSGRRVGATERDGASEGGVSWWSTFDPSPA
jgi:hypothetical protein